MYLTASSARSASFAVSREESASDQLDESLHELTFEFGEQVEGVFVSWRLSSNVSGQDRIGIIEDISLLEIRSNEVTDRIDLVC